MRLCLLTLVAVSNVFAQEVVQIQSTPSAGRQELFFDQGWRFHRGGAEGAEATFYDDSNWRKVNLPHDWSIENLPGKDSPFDPDATSQVSGGFTVGDTGWYRKTFTLPPEQKGRRVVLQFDGAYMNASVWLNGHSFGSHPYGYTPFWFDVTKEISFASNNILAVKISNIGENSRWYSGSGLYRHVWLKFLDPVHVAHDGIYLTTPQISPDAAKIRLQIQVANQTDSNAPIRLVNRIVSNRGEEVATSQVNESVGPNYSKELTRELTVTNPVLWSVDQPVLYTNITEIYCGDRLADRVATPFGIRQTSFDVEKGFCLNGQPLKLRGGCLHGDNGPLGAASYDRAEERKVEILKASGFNAVRCAHNPPAPAFLDACDRLGMLVLDEAFDTWSIGKKPFDYSLYFNDWWQKDLRTMVERDRNHPSVILWSIGNEIPGKTMPSMVTNANTLANFVRKLDPTRPVTAAVNGLSPDDDPFFAALDVGGYNYSIGGDHGIKDIYGVDHKRVPGRVMVCTESYPLDTFNSWMAVLDHPYVIGDFVWTGWDYLGEASIGWRGYDQFGNFFPWNLAYCGDIDICGGRRPQSFYREALWKPDQLSVFVQSPEPSFPENPRRVFWSKWHFDDLWADWNWKKNKKKPLQVTVYSSCQEAELFLNGKSLGRKATDRSTEFKAVWPVPYAPGTLQAVGYDAGQKVATNALRTAGSPDRIRLTADRSQLQANGEDLSYITVEMVDAHGVVNPDADNLVHFKIEGPGTIVGVGNANPMSLESCQDPERRCWHGRCLVIVKASGQAGKIILRATANGLPAARLTLAGGF